MLRRRAGLESFSRDYSSREVRSVSRLDRGPADHIEIRST